MLIISAGLLLWSFVDKTRVQVCSQRKYPRLSPYNYSSKHRAITRLLEQGNSSPNPTATNDGARVRFGPAGSSCNGSTSLMIFVAPRLDAIMESCRYRIRGLPDRLPNAHAPPTTHIPNPFAGAPCALFFLTEYKARAGD